MKKSYEEKLPECEINEIHEKAIKSVMAECYTEEEMIELAELYKIFGDSTRIRILSALMKEELCVCDIAEILKISVSGVSHQLRILKQARLVKFRREGKTVYYSLADNHVKTIIAQGAEHINE
jgi:ArsR family transcriptional regulator